MNSTTWTYTKDETVEKDWNFYSKAWHRAHGPKVTISNRRVIFTSDAGEVRTVELNAWRGDWLARAVVEAGLEPATKTPLAVRLNKAYDAVLLAEKRGYRTYQRTLLGQVVDYVIVSPMGVTFHHADRAQLVSGLHQKIRASMRPASLPGRSMLSLSVVKALGFCDSGIRAFCDTFGLSIKGEYSPREIEARVRADVEAARPFIRELEILSRAIGYNVIEFN